MAIRRLAGDDDIAPGFPALSDAGRGAVAENRLAIGIWVQAPATASIAFPLLDLGFDLYLRRVRTLRVHPIQVKARSFLGPDGQFEVGVGSLHLDPNGYLVFPYIPPPDWQLQGKLWAIPIPQFIKVAQKDGQGYIFSSYFGRAVTGPETAFLADVDRLASQWLAKIPGWTEPVQVSELGAGITDEVARPQARALGKFAELWLASDLVRAGMNRVVIAQDRLRVDCVDLVLHDLDSFAVAGLMVHAASIETLGDRRIVEFRIREKTFFVDPRLDLVLIACKEDRSLHETAFLIPSVDIPRLISLNRSENDPGYLARFRVDEIPAKFRPYAIPTLTLGETIIDRHQKVKPKTVDDVCQSTPGQIERAR